MSTKFRRPQTQAQWILYDLFGEFDAINCHDTEPVRHFKARLSDLFAQRIEDEIGTFDDEDDDDGGWS